MNRKLVAELPLATGPAAYDRVAKLALYRECIATAKAIPEDQLRRLSLSEVRDKWRKGIGAGGHSLGLQIATCLDRLAFGKLSLSKHRQRMLPKASETYDWSVQNPLENHQVVLKRKEEKENPASFMHGAGHREFVPMTNWGLGNMDPDVVMRHKELTDRQYFMGPHWRGKPKPLLYEDLSFEEQMAAHFVPPPKIKHKVKKRF